MTCTEIRNLKTPFYCTFWWFN